jgi:DNA-binding CsgD family transcriptional regulator
VGRDDVLAELLTALRDPDEVGVVVTAPAGAGKTRLLREAAASASVDPLWWQASRAASGVPFGVLAEVIDGDGLDAAQVFRRVATLAEEAGGLVVVDDAPHLDARSADLLRRLVDAGKVTVAATAREGEEVPDWLEWLWLGERTRHVRLDPLGDEATATLVDLVLDDVGDGDREAVARSLADRTHGNALFLRELLVDLRRRLDEGGPLEVDRSAPPHLLRVLEARQRAAGPEVLAALLDVAVAGSLPWAVAERRSGATALAAAERAAYVAVGSEGGRETVRPAHPLQAEAALGALTAAERRSLAIAVASEVLDEPTATVAERLAATTALVDAGARVEVGRLLDAARTAFSALDHDLAIRLATAAVAAGDPFEAKVVLGAALSGADRADEAEAALRDALASATTDDQRARAAGRTSVHLVAHGGRIDEATELLDAVAAMVEDPTARSFLDADRAKLASIRGDLAALGAADLADDADELTVLNHAIVGAYAQAMAGDAEACRATIARALPLAAAHRAVLPWSGELVRFSGPFAALVADGPLAALAEAETGLTTASAGSGPTVGTWRFLLGFSAAVAGRLADAGAALALAAEELEGHDLIGARPLAVASHAWVAAQAGDVTTARALLDRSVDAAALDGRVRTQTAVADAWCDVHEGGVLTSGAAAKVVEAAVDAAAGGQITSAVIVLHELVRLGDPSRAADALERATRSAPSSWLVRFVLERARAEAAGDDAALARLARRAEGRWPLAEAELLAIAWRRATARHDAAVAGRAAFDAGRAIDGLGAAVATTLADVASPLTARELEVATAVARGATNREVAEVAGVSVRTVENQLQSVYRKLGLAGRAELPGLFEGSVSP